MRGAYLVGLLVGWRWKSEGGSEWMMGVTFIGCGAIWESEQRENGALSLGCDGVQIRFL